MERNIFLCFCLYIRLTGIPISSIQELPPHPESHSRSSVPSEQSTWPLHTFFLSIQTRSFLHKNWPGHSCWTHFVRPWKTRHCKELIQKLNFVTWISETTLSPALILGQVAERPSMSPSFGCVIPIKCHFWFHDWQKSPVPLSSWNGWTRSIL